MEHMLVLSDSPRSILQLLLSQTCLVARGQRLHQKDVGVDVSKLEMEESLIKLVK